MSAPVSPEPAVPPRRERSALTEFVLSPVQASSWRALAAILLGFVVAVTAFAVVSALFSTGASLLIFVVGIPIIALGMEAARLSAAVERWRMAMVDGAPLIPRPHRPLNPTPTAPLEVRLRNWAEAEFLDASRWFDVVYVAIALPLAVIEFTIVIVLWTVAAALVLTPPLLLLAVAAGAHIPWQGGLNPWAAGIVVFLIGLILVPVSATVGRGLATLHRFVVEGLLCMSPTEALRRENERLRESRSATVELEATELRRIERDLHDGAQQRLVMLAIDLSLAEDKVDTEPAAAKTLIAGARDQARQALAEIREVVRGTAPAILLDRGLTAALSAVAGRATVPTFLDSDLPAGARLPHAVERAAYYVVSEALTNVAKHSGATRCAVTVRREPTRLGVWVRDDGRGGAAVAPGGGLAGLRARVQALDRELLLHSPARGAPGPPGGAAAAAPPPRRTSLDDDAVLSRAPPPDHRLAIAVDVAIFGATGPARMGSWRRRPPPGARLAVADRHRPSRARTETTAAMRRLIDFYRLQIEVMRTWRPRGRSRLRRMIVSLIVSMVSLAGAVALTPGFDLVPGGRPFVAALGGAIILAVLNLAVRPLLIGLFAGVSVIAVAIATVLFQMVSFLLLPWLLPDLYIRGALTALVASIVYALVNTTLTAALSITDDDSYWSVMLQQLAARREGVVRTDKPGLVVIQIDGLARPILARQVQAGRVPHLSAWLRSGQYRLDGWEALLPPTTPASQAGILHGNNDGIPAFRWYEKDAGRLMVANHPEDALVVASRISNGEGLLSNDGASVGNLFSGDAARSYISMATIKDKEQGLGRSQTFASFFASPYNWLGTLVRSIAEIVKEYVQARRAERAGIVPRMHRGMPYPVARAATNVALRDLSTALVIEEMYRGAPVIYVDYTDYDEIAHHSGPERSETLDALDGVDRAIATLEKAGENAPRPYRYVVVSDHGQTLGSTFLQRYGQTLGDVVRGLIGGATTVAEATGRVEEFGQTNAFLSELVQTRGASGRLAGTALRSQTEGGAVELKVGRSGRAAAEAADAAAKGAADRPDLVAIASGNLGLVYFPQMPGRVTIEQLADRYPGLVEALAAHPGIGAILVDSDEHGSIVIGHQGIHFLADDRIEGVDPVAQYRGRSLEAFRRLDGLSHVPDLSIVSLYDPEFDEVAAFEELIGSHGGLGGPQTHAMLLHPAEWALDEELLGAEAVYRQIRRWAERELGLRFGRDGSAEPLAMPKPQADPESASVA